MKNKHQADFFLVYIREAHTDDGWQVLENELENINIFQPTSIAARTGLAKTCADGLQIKFPVLVDDMYNSTAKSYSAWPDRLYIVAADGKIGYKGAMGPSGFNVPELATALESLLESAANSSDPAPALLTADEDLLTPLLWSHRCGRWLTKQSHRHPTGLELPRVNRLPRQRSSPAAGRFRQ